MHKPSLSTDDAVVVWTLRWEGWKHSEIANHLKTNGGRVSEILTEQTHVGTREKAALLLGLPLDAWPPCQRRPKAA